MALYSLGLISLTLLVLCVCSALAGDTRSKQYWAMLAAILAAFAYLGVEVLGTRQISNLGAKIDTPGFVYVATALAQYLAALCGIVAIVLPSRSGRRTPLYLIVGLLGLVLSRCAATFLQLGELDVYFVLWLLVVLGVLSAVADGSGDFIARLSWIPRFVIAASLLSAAIVPGWAFMTVDDSQRSIFGLGRLMGITAHPNSLAHFAVVSLCFELFGPRRMTHRKFWALCAASCGVLTQSTTALFALGVLLVIWLLTAQSRWRIYAVSVTILALAWVASARGGIFDTTFDTERFQSTSGRQAIWGYSWASIDENPAIGLGKAFLSDDFRTTYLPANQQQAVHAHNQVIQTLGESGYIGAFFLTIVFGGLLVHALQYGRAAGFGLVATWSAIALLSYTEVIIRPAGPTGLTGILVLAFLSRPPEVADNLASAESYSASPSVATATS